MIQSKCVDRIEHEKVIWDLNQLTAKHRNILQKQIVVVSVAISYRYFLNESSH